MQLVYNNVRQEDTNISRETHGKHTGWGGTEQTERTSGATGGLDGSQHSEYPALRTGGPRLLFVPFARPYHPSYSYCTFSSERFASSAYHHNKQDENSTIGKKNVTGRQWDAG